jgi:baculoviral IAP repeat-containing protein 7/8
MNACSSNNIHQKFETPKIQATSNRIDLDYKKESDRLLSFEIVQHQFLQEQKENLARQGFYLLALPDTVKCKFCGLALNDWKPNDNPLAEHLKFSRNCDLLKRRETENVPIDDVALNNLLPEVSYDECGYERYDNKKYVYPEYKLPNARMQTFETWPLSLKQKPEDLVEAGFYYTGMADRVICFCCGLGLGRWEENDIPWVEHAKHDQECEYLKFNYGENAIAAANVVAKPDNDVMGEIMEKPCGADCENLCKICFEKPNEFALVPCGHVLCRKCAFVLDTCPHCRQKIQKKLHLFFS